MTKKGRAKPRIGLVRFESSLKGIPSGWALTVGKDEVSCLDFFDDGTISSLKLHHWGADGDE